MASRPSGGDLSQNIASVIPRRELASRPSSAGESLNTSAAPASASPAQKGFMYKLKGFQRRTKYTLLKVAGGTEETRDTEYDGQYHQFLSMDKRAENLKQRLEEYLSAQQRFFEAVIQQVSDARDFFYEQMISPTLTSEQNGRVKVSRRRSSSCMMMTPNSLCCTKNKAIAKFRHCRVSVLVSMTYRYRQTKNYCGASYINGRRVPHLSYWR